MKTTSNSFLYIYIYIYIYMCVCVCACVCIQRSRQPDSTGSERIYCSLHVTGVSSVIFCIDITVRQTHAAVRTILFEWDRRLTEGRVFEKTANDDNWLRSTHSTHSTHWLYEATKFSFSSTTIQAICIASGVSNRPVLIRSLVGLQWDMPEITWSGLTAIYV